jgi:tetratricopeptide (TPR) repeat protein
MTRAFPAVLALAFCAALPAQEPSKNDLKRLLHADVKDYANDGRFVVTWAFKAPRELAGFEASSVSVLENDGLCFSPAAQEEAVLTFKELELEQPCRVALEVRLQAADSAFVVTFGNPARPDERFNVGVNAVFFSNSKARYDFIGRMTNAAYDGYHATKLTSAGRGAWTPIVIDWRKDRLALTVGKTEVCQLGAAPLKRFNVVVVAIGSKTTIRNLALDSQVNRDSMRKLHRALKATEAPASKPAADAPAPVGNPLEKIAKEMDEEGLDEESIAELKALPQGASNALTLAKRMEGSNPGQAEEALDQAIKLAPAAGTLLMLRGLLADRQGDGAKALAFFEKAVAVNAKLHAGWMCLAQAHADRQQFGKAIEALTTAEALQPQDPWSHFVKSQIHLENLKLDDAMKEVERALHKRPSSEGLQLYSNELARLRTRPNWSPSYPKANEYYVVETSISSKVAADLAQSLRVYRRFLEEKFPIGAKQTEKSRVWVFDSATEYHQFAALAGDDINNSVGVYNKLTKTLLLTSKVSAETTQQTLFHEAFHQYLDLAVPHPPIWLNEGLAEYYGATTFDVSNKPNEGGIAREWIATLKRGRLRAVRDLMNLSPAEFMHPGGVGVHYAESWALVHYFKRGGIPSHTALFDEYVRAVLKGESQAAAFEATFGKDRAMMDKVERAFGVYVTGTLVRQ